MKRAVAALLLCLMALVVPGAASAHTMSLAAAVSLSGNEWSVRALDVYGAPLEGATVSGVPVLAGGKAGKALTFTEGPAGTYKASVPGAGDYALRIEVRMATELFRVEVPVKGGQGFAEKLLPMQPVEEQPGFNWGPVLYGAAVIVLATGTAYALLRRRQTDDDEEE
ncbi:MAG TPA: hypothetical protein VK464_14740 [Symbiobacteriaceae bacterium]|jgi:hypothetical protein|nr:hypothetical protein [Symbiobacteriaceae bacterium]